MKAMISFVSTFLYYLLQTRALEQGIGDNMHSTTFKRYSTLIPALCCMSALHCGGDATEPASEQEQEVWVQANAEIHRIHLLAFEESNIPSEVSIYDCEDGGTLTMTLAFDGTPSFDTITDLYHRMEDCQVDGMTLNGDLDYRFASICPTGLFFYRILGALEVTGRNAMECSFAGQHDCGEETGKICGREI